MCETDIEATLGRWFAAMTACDLEGAMRCCHPEIRLAMHFGDVPLPFIGVTHGIEAARKRTEQVFATWRFPASDFNVYAIEGNHVRARLSMTVLHRWTGFSTDVKVRQQFLFEDGLIRSFDGYMDAPRFNAFMRFVGLAPNKSAANSRN